MRPFNISVFTMVSVGVFCVHAVASPSSSDAGSAGTSRIAAAIVENMPSTDVVRFVVSPPMAHYDSKIVCSSDSIRIRFFGLALHNREVSELDIPSGSTLKKVRVVQRGPDNSVLQIHPTGKTLDACDRLSVMSLEGNLIVSMVLTDGQKRRRMALLQQKAALGLASVAPDSKSDAEDAINPAPAIIKDNGKIDGNASSDVTAEHQFSKKEKDNKLAGTIFDKSRSAAPPMQTIEQTNSQTMKYAGGLLFAAILGFVAWFMKKKKTRRHIVEDNIDILSSKKLGMHQTLMVARVNGSRFLLAVGDKTVTSLGLIPSESGAESIESGLRAEINNAVKDSLAREPKISATPYSEVRDEKAAPAKRDDTGTSNFSYEFQQAIDKIVRERDTPKEKSKRRTEARQQISPSQLTNAFSASEPPSNVSGLISMARMRTALEQQSTNTESNYRA
ncbi:MAG: flagellar biosynthetic protein FliO [Deltaproteobacteria bacterium]|nr:flagellar biosynthetic protein FliO [Deltaproteobacteria bacterium]